MLLSFAFHPPLTYFLAGSLEYWNFMSLMRDFSRSSIKHHQISLVIPQYSFSEIGQKRRVQFKTRMQTMIADSDACELHSK